MSRERTSCSTTWKTPTGWVLVRDALTIGPRRGEDLVTPHTRPPTDEDADHLLVRVAMCLEGEVEMELTCEPVFDYGRAPGAVVGRRRRPQRRRERRGADDQPADGHGARHRGRLGAGPGTCSSRASRSTARSPGPRSSPRPRTSTRPTTRLAAHHPLLARLAGPRAHTRPSLARSDPALGACDQGPHLHADRRDGRGADHLAARDARRGAQLGLPLHVAARLDLHAAGASLPQPRLGGRGVHAVRRRPRAQRGRRAADHVRDRRPARSDRVHAR